MLVNGRQVHHSSLFQITRRCVTVHYSLLYSLIMITTDGVSGTIDDSILREALHESIQQLPQGTIRTALEEDFDAYYDKLKR